MKLSLSLNFLNKRLSAVVCACLIAASAAIGVSAKEYGTLLDWGWYLSSTSVSSSSSLLSCSRITLPYTTQGTNNYIFDMFGISLKSGYTYTYTNTVEVSYGGSISSFVLTRAWYSLSSPNNLSTSSYIDSMLISVEKLDTNKFKLTCVFNVDNSGLLSTDVYFYVPFLKLFYGGSGSKVFSSGNQGLVVTYDPGGSEFQQDIVDAVNAIREDNENYHSNALELLNAGSDLPLPDSAASQLESSLGSLSSAESSLSSKADELRTAGSATMSSAIAAAKDLPSKIGSSTSFLTSTFTKFWEAVPPEVTAVLLVCAAILFAGWLIGRVQ